MALTFAAGTAYLTSWGFGPSDIAVLAGAGRAAGTWLVAQLKDRALLDFLSMDIDTVISRKGLVDTVSLHQRWDRKLRLLQNNVPTEIHHPAGTKHTLVDSMDRFTWIMTLIVAALDASVDTSSVNKITLQFLHTLLQDSPNGTEYMQREINQHVQAWRSSACVRGILNKSYQTWAALERGGKHWPGNVPVGEDPELLAFLLWLVTDQGPTFVTGSSDIFCVAAMLQELGISLKAFEGLQHADDHQLRVILSEELFATRALQSTQPWDPDRRGMRIPLRFMQECVSLWPEDIHTNNVLRQIFENGMHAVEEDELRLILTVSGGGSLSYVLHSRHRPADSRRLSSLESRVAAYFLLLKHAFGAAKHLSRMISRWPEDSRLSVQTWLHSDPSPFELETDTFHLARHATAELQVFLMGFYYKLLVSLLDTSLLSLPEAFGHWTFYDMRFLVRIALFVDHQRDISPLSYIPRSSVLALITYLFAGGEAQVMDYIADAPSQTMIRGVISKLSVLSQTCLGTVGDFDDCGKFVLLDVDTSCFPRNNRGIIIEAEPVHARSTCPAENLVNVADLHTLSLDSDTDDFTAQIEPDWDHDLQSSFVVFRHGGRLIDRISPTTIESALLYADGINNLSSSTAPEQIAKTSVLAFHNGQLFPEPEHGKSALVIPTANLPKARVCIMALLWRVLCDDAGFFQSQVTQVSSEKGLAEAIAQKYRYIFGKSE